MCQGFGSEANASRMPLKGHPRVHDHIACLNQVALINSSESEWGDEPNDDPVVQCFPPMDLPLCDVLGEKFLTAAEMDAEIDYLYSLLEAQDKAYETKSGSPTLEASNPDARKKEQIEPLVVSESYMPFEESLPILALNNPLILALDGATLPTESPLVQEFLNVEWIDFLGVDDFDFLYRAYIVKHANKVDLDAKRSSAMNQESKWSPVLISLSPRPDGVTRSLEDGPVVKFGEECAKALEARRMLRGWLSRAFKSS
ncbi:hypothetical protein RHMOL_Rhmol04G0153800 [Rhododendron molle]|uniref:Uncharacterized protein n=1 Tax=Rhododendron molle TaxID=49168 RepID=A0ACC0P209_RHOML|nr:hypothetical protein RHMOL_Rhmol04G0153800 [Rhododendron molle]